MERKEGEEKERREGKREGESSVTLLYSEGGGQSVFLFLFSPLLYSFLPSFSFHSACSFSNSFFANLSLTQL